MACTLQNCRGVLARFLAREAKETSFDLSDGVSCRDEPAPDLELLASRRLRFVIDDMFVGGRQDPQG